MITTQDWIAAFSPSTLEVGTGCGVSGGRAAGYRWPGCTRIPPQISASCVTCSTSRPLESQGTVFRWDSWFSRCVIPGIQAVVEGELEWQGHG